MDLDNDGSLTYKEIIAAEKTLKEFKIGGKWQDIIKKCDLDGDGKIDFHEFFTAAVDHQKVITKQNLKYAFETFDTNGDGNIDIDEFKSALPSNNGGKMSMHSKTLKTMSTGQSAMSIDDDNDTWTQIMNEIDTDGNGSVSFEEFCNAIEGFITKSYTKI